MSGFFVFTPTDLLKYMDAFENLGIKAAQIKAICEAACTEAGFVTEPRQASLGPEAMAWRSLEITARLIIAEAWGGGTDPSPFKILAATSLAIVSLAPIPDYFPAEFIEREGLPDICTFDRAPAAVMAIDYSLSILHKSKIGDLNIELSEPLTLSSHSWKDLMSALTVYGKTIRNITDYERCPTSVAKENLTKSMFNTTSLIFEMIAYKSNPGAQSATVLTFARG